MDLNALLQAAMQDPAARDFIGKMVGGAAPQPQGPDPRAMMAQSIQSAGRAPTPAFSGAKRAVDEMLRGFDPMRAAQPPQAPPQAPQGAPAAPPGMGMAPQPGMAPPAPAPGQGGMGMPPDLMSMLMGGR
jgi:hypothetical protein